MIFTYCGVWCAVMSVGSTAGWIMQGGHNAFFLEWMRIWHNISNTTEGAGRLKSFFTYLIMQSYFIILLLPGKVSDCLRRMVASVVTQHIYNLKLMVAASFLSLSSSSWRGLYRCKTIWTKVILKSTYGRLLVETSRVYNDQFLKEHWFRSRPFFLSVIF